MQNLFGQEVSPRIVQGNLLAGRAGLGVSATARTVAGVEYLRIDGYWLRADGVGVLMVELPAAEPLEVQSW